MSREALRRLAEAANGLPAGSEWMHGEVADGAETVAEWMDKCSAHPDALAAGRLWLVWSEGSGETKVVIQAIVGDTETAPIRAAFMANANPAAVLELLDELDELRLMVATVNRRHDDLAEDRDAARAEVERLTARLTAVRYWIESRGVDVGDRDDEYMRGYRAAQRHAIINAAEALAILDGRADQ